jgi:hypothetical protein
VIAARPRAEQNDSLQTVANGSDLSQEFLNHGVVAFHVTFSAKFSLLMSWRNGELSAAPAQAAIA